MSPAGRPDQARNVWGWGLRAAALDKQERTQLERLVTPLFGGRPAWARPPSVSSIELPAARVAVPRSLARLVTSDPAARIRHTYGKSFRDVVRGLAGDFAAAPDGVAYPTSEAEVESLLDWASAAGAVVVPFGGGSSVVGGVEVPPHDRGDRPVVSLDVTGLAGVREIDRTSRAALIRAGTFGPAIEDALRPHDLTLRHFPQSFEFSTLGGWLATRAGGHFATLHTHIDDFVESIRAVTPSGIWESRRLPGSGAGPSPDRLLLGSEGSLGVITEAWMRLQDRPTFTGSFVASFGTFDDAAEGARLLAQSGLWPQNCRVLDAVEAAINGVGDGQSVLLLVAFESAHVPVDTDLAVAAELVRSAGGSVQLRSAEKSDAAGDWRRSFLRAPYIRDGLVRLGLINETLETATTWDRLPQLVDGVRSAIETALTGAGCGPNVIVSCRLTHVYPDGAAPYFTVVAPGRPGIERLAQWAEVKEASMEAIGALGGTVTHHHAVGRDHRPGYDRQAPPPFIAALQAAKSAVDPSWVLNPGVLFDREP